MTDSFRSFFVFHIACLVAISLSPNCLGDEDSTTPYGMDFRTPWLGSRVVGSPDPPLPYVAVPTLTKIKWDRPIYVKAEPDSNNLIVVQQGGEADRPTKILRASDHPAADTASVLLEVPQRLVYGLEFDPNYASNGYLYLFSNGPVGQSERQNRISRYVVSRDAKATVACDPNSELTIIQWRSMGHDGGDLVFGHDGMLYATSGDGTSDSDHWLSAQDVTNLLGGVLRIDVQHSTVDQPYSIPSDNPFVAIPNARAELWAIGLRNPWRMTVDSQTGQIWVGSNGQDLWESVNLLGRGENYGWSVYEGSHRFYAHRELGPGKLTVPTFEHHHSESRSLTGGVVYAGDRLADLKGAYVYGDYATGKIWAGRHDGTKVTWHREIADTALQIAGFSNSHQGELLVVDHAGGIHRLQVNPMAVDPDEKASFPKRLSDTGIFQSVGDHRVAAGIIPYSVNSPAWNDGATVERFIAIPENRQIEYTESRGWNFPEGSVLLQTLSLEVDANGSIANRRIETRILTRQQGEWSGYSYQWNSQQDDAILVDGVGKDVVLDVSIDGRVAEQRAWRIPGRAECMSCHARAVNYVLGLTELQMNRTHDYADFPDNQLRTLQHIEIFAEPPSKPIDQRTRLPDPHDATGDLESRAKAYLHTNCSCCHVAAGGGNSRMELEYTRQLEAMEVVSCFPQHDTFEISQPLIVAPGEPDRSVMLARISRRGRGQMPPLGSSRVDQQGIALIKQWMAAMPSNRKLVKNWTFADLKDQLHRTTSGRSFERGEKLFGSAGCNQCHRIQDRQAGIGPNLNGLSSRLKINEILTSIVSPSLAIDDKYANTILLTDDGQMIQGRVEAETDDAIVLRGSESPATSMTILKESIQQRRTSRVSTMPEGTINHLELEEVLDLLTYLIAEGDSKHPAYAD